MVDSGREGNTFADENRVENIFVKKALVHSGKSNCQNIWIRLLDLDDMEKWKHEQNMPVGKNAKNFNLVFVQICVLYSLKVSDNLNFS